MRFFLRYLSLEGKKSLIAARKSMVKFIVMLLLIAGGSLAVSLVMRDAGVFQTAEIGVVIPEDEAQTKMVAQFISAMDSVPLSVSGSGRSDGIAERGYFRCSALTSGAVLRGCGFREKYTGNHLFPGKCSVKHESVR